MGLIYAPKARHHSRTTLFLRSMEGFLHEVDPLLLRQQSELFRTMLTLPAPPSVSREGTTSTPAIDVFEKDATLSAALNLLRGGTVFWESIQDAYPVLELVEKWDCPEVMARLRKHLSSCHIPREQPLRFYALANYFRWTEEARQASKHTLSLDFDSPAHLDILQQIPQKDAQLLRELRNKRCWMFRKLLDSPTRFTGGNSSFYFCDCCCTAHPQDDLWRNFKLALMKELNRIPAGTTILKLVKGEDSCPEADGCWTAICPTPGCNSARFDRKATLRQIWECIDTLPCFID